MTKIWDWIANEWNATSTHVWLAGAGTSLIAYANGSLTMKQFIAALVVSAIGIIVPQTPAKP